ncbi:MAG: SUMF1/EgtB/PvdO family nonheme iron enzyme [Planctomycetes bacterium]|nr:SUMF1/EgtB/PvdO family nonheme iron enzyme [Planctomycetota bacterium]
MPEIREPSPATAATVIGPGIAAAPVDDRTLVEHVPPEFADLPAKLASWRTSSTRSGEPRFVLRGRLGAGSQGIVFAVADNDCRRDVALKTLHHDQRDRALSRFVHEAQITAQLEHPGIVPVHDFGILDDGTVFYTMKRIAGDSLADLLERGSSGRHELLQLFVRICQTIAFAHHHGVIHRDLKPRNIMVGTYGEVLVLDWGLAKILGHENGPRPVPQVDTIRSDQGRDETIAGFAVGTPAYMSPEQALGELDRVDGRADIYALGVILYELLAGRSPYVRGDVRRTLEQAATGQWTPIDRQPGCRGLPRRLVAIVHQAMALDPAARYGDADALASDITGFVIGSSVSAYRESPLESLARWLGNHRRPVASAALALLASIAVGTAWWGFEIHRRGVQLLDARHEAQRAELASDLDHARRSYERVLDLVPRDADAQHGLDRVVRGLALRAVEQTRSQAAVWRERARLAEQDGRLKDAIAALHGALAVLPSVEDSDALAHLLLRQDTIEAQRTSAQRMREAGVLLQEAERSAQGGHGREAQERLDQARGLCAEHPDLARCERLVQDALVHEREGSASALLERARASQGAAVDLEASISTGRTEVDGLLLDLVEAGTQEIRARLHRAEQRQALLRDQRENALADAVSLLHQAYALAPDFLPVRRALADFFIARLVEAEADGHRAEAAAAEAQARIFDDGANASLLAGEAEVSNIGATSIRLRPLVEQENRTDAASGNGFKIDPRASARVPHGRYIMSSDSGSVVACRLERGSTRELSLPIPPALPAMTAFIPAGIVYGQDGRQLASVASFALAVHEVTCGEYLEFLNDPETLKQFDRSLSEGRLHFAPRSSFDAAEPDWRRKTALRSGGGDFVLESPGRSARRAIAADAPVSGIDFEDAQTYAAWRARRDGIPWRLPTRCEWQLAAQGGDGRTYPWGMSADLGHCRSSTTVALHADFVAGSFPVDRSVQGVMDLAGSLSEFVSDAAPADGRRRLLMGGNYHDSRPERYACLSQREVDARWVHPGCGMRLAFTPR